MSEEAAGAADRFLALAESLAQREPRLSGLQAGILAADYLDLAHDSRTFARRLGVAHALVLRELAALADFGDILEVSRRDARTMRTHYATGAAGRLLVEAALAS